MNFPGCCLSSGLATGPGGLLAGLLIWAAVTDLTRRQISNHMVAIGLALGLGLAVWQDVLGCSVLGAVAGGLLLSLPNLFARGSVGMGDIKLFAVIGLFGGPATLAWILGLSALGAWLYWLGQKLLVSHREKSIAIPLAPFALLGDLAASLSGFY